MAHRSNEEPEDTESEDEVDERVENALVILNRSSNFPPARSAKNLKVLKK